MVSLFALLQLPIDLLGVSQLRAACSKESVECSPAATKSNGNIIILLSGYFCFSAAILGTNDITGRVQSMVIALQLHTAQVWLRVRGEQSLIFITHHYHRH